MLAEDETVAVVDAVFDFGQGVVFIPGVLGVDAVGEPFLGAAADGVVEVVGAVN